MIHVGIDLHSRMKLVALKDNGELLSEVKTKSSPEGLSGFFSRFTEPAQAAVECTSYWYWVADGCSSHDIALQLAHAKMLKAITYAKVKTDSVDARTRRLQSSLWQLAAKYNVLVQDVGWRYLDRLLAIPGFGPVVSWTIFSEIGDIGRFPSVSNLSAIAGWCRGSKTMAVAIATEVRIKMAIGICA